jgi:hypothetical protein
MVAFALIAGIVLVLRPVTTDVLGVRLGMTMKDTRDRFTLASGGSWKIETGPDAVLSWKNASAGEVRSAAFEFHSALLVAMRFEVAASSSFAKGPAIEVSATRVLAREAQPAGAGDGVTLTIIARDCPTHADEVKQLVSRAGR